MACTISHQSKLMKYANRINESLPLQSLDIWFCAACDTPNRHDMNKCALCNLQRPMVDTGDKNEI